MNNMELMQATEKAMLFEAIQLLTSSSDSPYDVSAQYCVTAKVRWLRAPGGEWSS